MWFWIWCALVLGTLAGAFFLGRDLWRRARTMLRSGAGLSEALAAMSERVDELEQAGPASTPRPVTVFADEAERVALAERVAARRRAKRLRAQYRRGQHADRYETWRRIDL